MIADIRLRSREQQVQGLQIDLSKNQAYSFIQYSLWHWFLIKALTLNSDTVRDTSMPGLFIIQLLHIKSLTHLQAMVSLAVETWTF